LGLYAVYIPLRWLEDAKKKKLERMNMIDDSGLRDLRNHCWTKLGFGFLAQHTQPVKPWPLASLRRVHIEHSNAKIF
jgi:hypothetical protein